MKVKMFRMSGRVVDPELLKTYEADFQKRFDELMDKYRHRMEEMPEELDKVDKELSDIYKTVVEIDFVKTKKDWLKLMETYGNILITKEKDTNNLLYIILDQ